MRTIKEADISMLRKDGKVKNSEGRNLKSVIPIASKKKPIPQQTAEERHTRAIEEMAAQLSLAIQANNKNAIELIDLIRQSSSTSSWMSKYHMARK